MGRRVNRKNTRRVNRKNTLRKKTRRVNRKNTLRKKTRRVNRKNTKLFGGLYILNKEHADDLLRTEVHPHRNKDTSSRYYKEAREIYYQIAPFLDVEDKKTYDRYFK